MAPSRAEIDVVCPVDGDTVAMTNRNWAFSIAETRIRLGLSRLEVVDDFVAIPTYIIVHPTPAGIGLSPMGGKRL